ncbi:glycosyltransferase family 2 protein [Croceibacterium salegens]|nr:glycosyltransferase family 2 protein [Croceibacterium salegens]
MLKLLTLFAAISPALALSIYSLEVLAGLRRLREASRITSDCRAVILIPAHDEAVTIGEAVRHLFSFGEANLELLVVADNCGDATAEVAREAGAHVVERTDPSRRGKGFALAFGRDYLATNPPDVVVILDADCRTDARSIERLIASASKSQAPVQATNLLIAPPNSDPIVQISNFAMLMKNSIRARGLYRLGGGIPLFGTGMAFPWAIFGNAPLASASIVEDLRLTLDLSNQDILVHFVESALVTSASAAAQDTPAQRRRWELGFVRIAACHALPLLAQGISGLSRHRIFLGMHLCVPPLAMLLLIGGGRIDTDDNDWPVA